MSFYKFDQIIDIDLGTYNSGTYFHQLRKSLNFISTICNGLLCMYFEAGIHNKVQGGPKASHECLELRIFTTNQIVAREKQNLGEWWNISNYNTAYSAII